MKFARSIAILGAAFVLSACGGGSGSGSPPEPQPPPTPTISVDVGVKQLIFNWPVVADMRWQASYYKLLENPDGHSGFTQVGEDIPAEMGSVRRDIAVHLFDFANALYILEACNNYLCSRSTEINVINGMLDTIGYFKASNTGGDVGSGPGRFLVGDWFGRSVAISAGGDTLAVGASHEDSGATGIDGDQDDNLAFASGAVYLFRYDGIAWYQQAYIKASNTDGCEHEGRCPNDDDLMYGDTFGNAIALSADGNTLVVGAPGEDSSATDIDGDQDDNSAYGTGAAYVFRFDGADWYQQAYVKASNGGRGFGVSVDLSADGNTLVAGGWFDNFVYIFKFDGVAWAEQDFVSGSNTEGDDRFALVRLSSDGNTLVVGAPGEDSNATGIDGDQSDNSVRGAGAAYVFRLDGTKWVQQAYIKASNTGIGPLSGNGDGFGYSVALSAIGDTLAVGAQFEDSDATGINGDQSNNLAHQSGAVYLFRFDGSEWFQQGYIKASDTVAGKVFGWDVDLTEDANTLVVNGHPAYIFGFDGTDWSELTNTDWPELAELSCTLGGTAMAISSDGQTVARGTVNVDSGATGIGSARKFCQDDLNDDSAVDSGAVFLY